MRLDGREVAAHPMASRDDPDLRPKAFMSPSGERVLAAMALDFGTIDTEEGRQSFAPEDYILTDDPPTHAWALSAAAFESNHSRT